MVTVTAMRGITTTVTETATAMAMAMLMATTNTRTSATSANRTAATSPATTTAHATFHPAYGRSTTATERCLPVGRSASVPCPRSLFRSFHPSPTATNVATTTVTP